MKGCQVNECGWVTSVGLDLRRRCHCKMSSILDVVQGRCDGEGRDFRGPPVVGGIVPQDEVGIILCSDVTAGTDL